MNYGRFSPDATEYIITQPDTPRPWYNRLGNSDYAVLLSQVGGGYSIAGGDRRLQLTWYVPRIDQSGRYVYLRDRDTGQAWNATLAPSRAALDRFECRHGLGWTTYVSSRGGIECDFTLFVPETGPVELWRVELRNACRTTRRISAFPFVEWSLDPAGQSPDDLVYAAESDGFYEPATQSVVGVRRSADRYERRHAFITTDSRAAAWDANRAAFVGPGRSLANPIAVERGRCTRTPAQAEVSVGTLQHNFTLPPGGSAVLHVMVGLADTRADRARLRRRYLLTGQADRHLQCVRDQWLARTWHTVVCTPDRKFDRYVNHWLAKHVWTMGSTPAVRQLHIGFRNYVQDAMGMLYLNPARSRELLLDAMQYQLRCGDCVLAFSRAGNPPRPPEHVDTKVWPVLATAFYLRETADFAILDERRPFLDHQCPAPVKDHLLAALAKCWADRGRHGLSLIGRGDWNDNLDGMGRAGKGESVWMSMAVHWALRLMSEVLDRAGDRATSRRLARQADTLRAAINRHGWDGQWYLMGYTDRGRPVGSRRSSQGRIFLLPQAWAVLSGVATPDRARKLFRAVDTRLATEFGPTLIDTPYTRPDKEIGRITFLFPGMNENGPVYSHGAAFKLCADGAAGRGQSCYDELLRLFPYSHDPTQTLAEPFVICNFYRPSVVPRKHGATHRSWTTSTPNWALRGVVENLFGVQADYDGLSISPAIPASWKRCSIRRPFRGDVYEVTILNPRGAQSGVRRITLDGRPLHGNRVPFVGDAKTHKVRVLM